MRGSLWLSLVAGLSGVEGGTGWGRTEVDRFVLEKLDEHGLRPPEEAGRYVLMRRLSLVLRGLPATVEKRLVALMGEWVGE